MASKIFRSTVLVAVIVLLAAIGIILGVLYDYFDGVQAAQLRDQLNLAAIGTEQKGLAYLRSARSDRFRLTWISPDGTVLYDTWADESVMENHRDREEIRKALEENEGQAVRYSSTLTEKTAYCAQALPDGSVLRISVRSVTTMMLVLGMLPPFFLVLLMAVALSGFLSHRMARRIVQPINRLDLEHPLDQEIYEELSPLLLRINQQHQQITAQMEAIHRQADEFRQITRNMNEGLVLLDRDGCLLSINPAANRILPLKDNQLPPDLRSALQTALTQGPEELKMSRDGREYQVRLSGIRSRGEALGAVMLILDITDRLSAEQTRREFSANVSHELKTPLQSIIGSAELLENGLVKPQDIPRFVGHIRREASRLVVLVEDILRLSQLDEGVALPMEEVDLSAVIREVLPTLEAATRKKNVSVRVTGTPCQIRGVRRLLTEIVSNLCDNAIKYNVPGGTVEISTACQDGETFLTVTDTGIGIPPEHRDRVFERFYRVDKSHSRQSGGTGLGLSIVKHAAQYHHARLHLTSTPGKGTSVTVTFPRFT